MEYLSLGQNLPCYVPALGQEKSLIVFIVDYLSLGHNLLCDVPVLRQEKSLIVSNVKHLLVGHYLLDYLVLSPHHLYVHWDAPNSYTGYHKFQEKHSFTTEITSNFFSILPGNYKYIFLQILTVTGVPPAIASLNYCTLREAVQFWPIFSHSGIFRGGFSVYLYY